MKRIYVLLLLVVLGVMLFPFQWVSIGAPAASGSWLRSSQQQVQEPAVRLVALEELDALPLAGADPLGRDPRRWRERLAEGNLRHQEIFPGIDLVFAGSKQKLEAILIVKAGADLANIHFDFPQAEVIAPDAQGNIWIVSDAGDLGLMRPQLLRQNKAVKGGFVTFGPRVGLRVEEHDAAEPLLVRFDVVFPTRPVNLLDKILYRVLKADEQAVRSPNASVASAVGDLTATKTVDKATAVPGETLTYTVTVNNTTGATINGVTLTDMIDPSTTLVGGSINASPIGVDDSYTASGNITMSPAVGVLGNDIDPVTNTSAGLTVTQVQGSTSNVGVATDTTATGRGGVKGSVTMTSTGSFTYEPPPGFTGSDTFTYRVSEPGGKTNTATVTITISNVVWFIKNDAGGLNRGTFSNPFTSIAAFNTANAGSGATPDPKNGDFIALRTGSGTYTETDGVNLRSQQKLIGEGVAFNTAFTADSNSSMAYMTFAAAAGTAPNVVTTLGNGVDLSTDNTVRGLNVGNTPGFFKINGGAVGSPVINTVNLTGTGGAINVSTSGTFGSTVNFGTLESTSSPTHNINLVGVTGTLGVTSGVAGMSGSAAASAAINVSGGSVNLSYPGNVTKNNTGALVNVAGGHGGTLTFTGTLNATNGTGLQFDNADGTYSFNSTTTLAGGDAGVDILNGSAGTFSFSSSTAITNPSGAGFLVNSSTPNVTYNGNITKDNVANTSGALVDITNQASGTITFQTGTLSSTSTSGTATGIQLTNADGVVNFNGTTTLNGGDAGIDILAGTDVTSGSAGTFSFGTGTSITRANSVSGAAFNLAGSDANVTYSGSMTLGTSTGNMVAIDDHDAGTITFQTGALTKGSSTTQGISIQNCGGGAINFNNPTITITMTSGNAVSLTSNTSSAINFALAGGSGMDLTTTSGDGFNATGGGTVTVTGSGNTITSTTGTALNLNGVTVGASHITFQSISANGGSNAGIIMQSTTGSSGTVFVTGTGTAGSGGTIANKSGANIWSFSGGIPTLNGTTVGAGVYLNNATAISLTRMQLNDFSNAAVSSFGSSGFTMVDSVVSGANGDDVPQSEAALFFYNASGTASITGSSIAGGKTDNIYILKTSGAALNRFTISSSTLGFNDTTTGNNNILVEARNAGTTLNFTLESSLIKGARADWINASSNSGATSDVLIGGSSLALGNTFDNLGANAHPGAAAGGNRVVTGATGTQTVDIRNNTLKGSKGEAIRVRSSGVFGGATGTVNARVRNNIIGVQATANSGSSESFGIFAFGDGGSDMTIAITNNTVYQYNNHGISLTFGDELNDGSSFQATVTGNTVNTPGNINTDFNGIHLNNGTVGATDNFTTCADIGGAGALANNVVGSGSGAISPNNAEIRLRQRQSTTIRLPGYGGANNDDAAVVAYLAGRNTSNTEAASNTVPTGGGFVGGAACTAPPFSFAPPIDTDEQQAAPQPNGNDSAMVSPEMRQWLDQTFSIFAAPQTPADYFKFSDQPISVTPAATAVTEPRAKAAPQVEGGGGASHRNLGQIVRPVLSAFATSMQIINPLSLFEGSAAAASPPPGQSPQLSAPQEARPAPDRRAAQERKDVPRRQKLPTRVLVSAVGSTMIVGPFNLAAGESVEIMYQVTINDPYTGTTNQVCNTGNVTYTGGPEGGVNTNAACTTVDLPNVNVAVSPSSTFEDGAGTLVYTFTREAPTTSAMTVNFSVAGSTASSTDDYTVSGASFNGTTGTVAIPIGSLTADVTVSPTDDLLVEPNETVVLNVTSGIGYDVGAPASASGTITNDDTDVTVAVSPLSVAEDGATNLVYTFTRTGVTTGALTVNFTVGGTATFNTDYTQTGAATFVPPNGTVSFAAGSSTATVTIDPAADSPVEPDETVVLAVTSGTGYNVGSPNSATGTISNDDADVTVAVSPSSVAEDGATNLVYTFTRTGVTTGALTVNFTVGGTATFNTDYTQTGAATFVPPNGTVIFGAGNSTATVTVDPSADTTGEPDETVILTLTSGAGYNVGSPDSATGTITNDDTTVTVAVAPSSVAEDGAINLTYTFTRSNTIGELTANFTVGGDATFNTDYTQTGAATFTASSGTVIFAAGSSTATVTISPTPDATVEPNETVILTVVAGSGYGVGSPSAATGTITNDDTDVTVAVSPGSVDEDGATNLTYTFTRTGFTGGALTVSFSVGGTATFSSDYTQNGAATFSANSGTVIFAASVVTAAVTISPTTDTLVEPDETVALTVTSGAGYNVGSPSAATGTITNDDTDVTVAVAPSSVLENGATNLFYTFTRAGVTTGALTVNFSVGGTATFSTDYTQTGADTFTATAGTVIFGAGNATATVTVDPAPDSTIESNETVILTVIAGAIYNVATPSVATGTITNDDTPQQAIEDLIDDVNALKPPLTNNQAKELIDKLNAAKASLNKNKKGTACNQLNAFINQVNSLIKDGVLTMAQGQSLLASVNAIRSAIPCGDSLAKSVGLFHPFNDRVYLKKYNITGLPDLDMRYGHLGDYPVAGDWDGDGIDTIGVYRDNTFSLSNSNAESKADESAEIVVEFGQPGDIPVVGDWDGDGVTTIGVYRNGVFLLRNSNTSGPPDLTFSFGAPGDLPLAGDWDGDGVVTVGVYNPVTGAFSLRNELADGLAEIVVMWGGPAYLPVVGDWDGDGVTTIGLYSLRGEFFLRNSNSEGLPEVRFTLGIGGGIPIVGTWE